MTTNSTKPYRVLILCGQPGTGKSSLAKAYKDRYPERVRVVNARKIIAESYAAIIKTPPSSFSHVNSHETAYPDGDENVTFGQALDDYYHAVRFCSPMWYIWVAHAKSEIDELNTFSSSEKFTFVVDDVTSYDECEFLLAGAESGAIVFVHGFPGDYKRTQPERQSYNSINDIADKVKSQIDTTRLAKESFHQCMFRCCNELQYIEESLSASASTTTRKKD